MCDLRASQCMQRKDCEKGLTAAVRLKWRNLWPWEWASFCIFCLLVFAFPIIIFSVLSASFIPSPSIFPFHWFKFSFFHVISSTSSSLPSLAPSPLLFQHGGLVVKLCETCWADCWLLQEKAALCCKDTVPLVVWQKGFAKMKGIHKANKWCQPWKMQLDVKSGSNNWV